MMSSATSLWKLFRDQAERGSGIGLKLFGFIAESAFTIIPESCSGSPRIAFGIIPESRSPSTGFLTIRVTIPFASAARVLATRGSA